MIPLVAIPPHVSKSDIQDFYNRYILYILTVVVIYEYLYTYTSIKNLLKTKGIQYCGEHGGFGGKCIDDEELRDLWMLHYEVRLSFSWNIMQR